MSLEGCESLFKPKNLSKCPTVKETQIRHSVPVCMARAFDYFSCFFASALHFCTQYITIPYFYIILNYFAITLSYIRTCKRYIRYRESRNILG